MKCIYRHHQSKPFHKGSCKHEFYQETRKSEFDCHWVKNVNNSLHYFKNAYILNALRAREIELLILY